MPFSRSLWLARSAALVPRMPSIVSPSWMPYCVEGWLRVSAEKSRSGGSEDMAVVWRGRKEKKKVECEPYAPNCEDNDAKSTFFPQK